MPALALVLAFDARPGLASSQPQARTARYVSIAYGKRAIRRYINRNYIVALGPYFDRCWKPSGNKVRCEVSFKAGIYWRCGRVTVRGTARYDYIDARLPIGC